MGQAKRRGTFEQRKAAAVTLNEIRFENQRRERIKRQKIEDHEADMREAVMSPEDKQKRHDARMGIAQMMGVVLGFRG